MNRGKHLLRAEDLELLCGAIFSQFDVTRARYLHLYEAAKEASSIAQRYHPNEQVILTKAVSQVLPKTPVSKIRPKRIEDHLQTYGFTIKPVNCGRTKVWCVGYGDVCDPSNESVGRSKNLRHAVEEAVVKKQRKEQEGKHHDRR